MKVIIAGGRDFNNKEEVYAAIEASGYVISEVVSGGASGVDLAGETWAKQRGIPMARFPADWRAHGKAAGPIRNRHMANYADALVAVWDGKSRGTRNMIEEMEKIGKPVYIHMVRWLDLPS